MGLRVLILLFVAGLPALGGPVDRSRQALVVTTPGWNSVAGTLRRFEKSAGVWKQVGSAIPVVVGKNGLAWDPAAATSDGAPVKHEGDGRSPAGIFPVTVVFGFDSAPPAPAMKYRPLTEQTECVDDVASKLYNGVVERGATQPDWNSSEKMRSVAGYRIGAIVGYNRHRRKGAGSCIFLHIWSGPDQGTAGCTAMEEPSLRAILESLDRKKRPVLVQMPEADYRKRRAGLRLP